jgi:hypothetical protein
MEALRFIDQRKHWCDDAALVCLRRERTGAPRRRAPKRRRHGTSSPNRRCGEREPGTTPRPAHPDFASLAMPSLRHALLRALRKLHQPRGVHRKTDHRRALCGGGDRCKIKRQLLNETALRPHTCRPRLDHRHLGRSAGDTPRPHTARKERAPPLQRSIAPRIPSSRTPRKPSSGRCSTCTPPPVGIKGRREDVKRSIPRHGGSEYARKTRIGSSPLIDTGARHWPRQPVQGTQRARPRRVRRNRPSIVRRWWRRTGRAPAGAPSPAPFKLNGTPGARCVDQVPPLAPRSTAMQGGAHTHARARFAGSSLAKIPEPTNTPSQPVGDAEMYLLRSWRSPRDMY